MNYFILHANCIPVKGYTNSLIVDLQRNEFTHIPNDLLNVLTDLKVKSVADALADYNSQDTKTVMEYLEWLVEKDLGMFSSCDEDLKRFSPINTSWNSPFVVTNIILYINDNTIDSVVKISNEINQLNINHCELFIENESYIQKVLEAFEFTTLRNIQMNIVRPLQIYNKKMYENYCIKHYRLSSITIFNSPSEFTYEEIFDGTVSVFLTPNKFQTNSCGVVSKDFFVANIKSYTESLHHNSCLNQKITIDANGDIKNCPSIPVNYGNIKETTLQQALDRKGFKQLWNIHKDQIKVCKDCEFRHVCTDCRAYVEVPGDAYSKPLKCGYDPYKGTWEEWSVSPLKQKAIEFYKLK